MISAHVNLAWFCRRGASLQLYFSEREVAALTKSKYSSAADDLFFSLFLYVYIYIYIYVRRCGKGTDNVE